MSNWLFIAAGGALGSVLRYAVHGWVQRLAGHTFPIGTLVVNVVGCLLIGLVAGLASGTIALREPYRLGLVVGVLGGFTTFSTYGLETLSLAESGHLRFAVFNVLLSNVIGLLAVWFGTLLAGK